MDEFANLFQNYNLLEYLGLGNNNFSNLQKLENMLSKIGKKEVSKELVADYEARQKDRLQIIEKNKKLKTLKKPEVYVPVIDPLNEKDGIGFIYYNKNM